MQFKSKDYYENSIWCYTDKLSAYPGEILNFRVSSPEPEFTCRITRIGQSEDVVLDQGGYSSDHHSTPDDAYTSGCQWPIAFGIEILEEWCSGYYRVQLIAENSLCEHFFVVKNRTPSAANAIALVLATNTYQAYNSWGGKCLYGSDHQIPGLDDSVFGDARITDASLARPFSRAEISASQQMRMVASDRRGYLEDAALPAFAGNIREEDFDTFTAWDVPAGFLSKWEHEFVIWAEREGYVIDYFVQADLDDDVECLYQYRCYASVGHDEYWTWAERDAVESYVEQGGNAFFMSANACYWQVRFDAERKQMICHKYKAHESDPVMGTDNEKYMTGIWSDPVIGRPENQMMGTSFTRGGYSTMGLYASKASGGYSIYRPDHWALENADLYYGDVLGSDYQLVGYELDGCAYTVKDGLPVPTGEDGTPEDFEIIAMALVTLGEPENAQVVGTLGYEDATAISQRIFGDDSAAGRERARRGVATMGSFRKGSGEVFNTGTTEWAYGLSNKDKHVEVITKNVLSRFLA